MTRHLYLLHLFLIITLLLFTFTSASRNNNNHNNNHKNKNNNFDINDELDHLLSQHSSKHLMTPNLAHLQKLPPITVSGLSSGAFFAVQMGVCFSRLIQSTAAIAGGVYNAAQGNVITALGVMENPELYISLPLIQSQLIGYETLQYIDPTFYLSHHTNYVFSGTHDSTVKPYNGDLLTQFYQHYGSDVKFVNTIPAEHAFLTVKDTTPRQCDYKGTPFINNCKFDLITDIYQTFYPQQPIKPPTNPQMDNLFTMDQFLFVPPQYNIFMLTNGIERRSFMYIPQQCQGDIITNPLFKLLQYDQERAEKSALPGIKQLEFEALRQKLWYESAIYTYMNGTNIHDQSGPLYNINHQQDDEMNKSSGTPQCRIHMAFHGCKQTLDHIGMDYMLNTGYLEMAESNNIITIFPQMTTTLANPNGCYDWWGYSTPLYATRYGVQPLTVMNQGVTIASMLSP